MGSIPTVKHSNENIFGSSVRLLRKVRVRWKIWRFWTVPIPNQWALVIVEQQGENFQVFRKLYVVQ